MFSETTGPEQGWACPSVSRTSSLASSEYCFPAYKLLKISKMQRWLLEDRASMPPSLPISLPFPLATALGGLTGSCSQGGQGLNFSLRSAQRLPGKAAEAAVGAQGRISC